MKYASGSLSWRDVPGLFNFDDIYQEAVRAAPLEGAHFVEIGVLFGKSAVFMADEIERSGKKIAFDAVDPLIPTIADLKYFMETRRSHQPEGLDPEPAARSTSGRSLLETLSANVTWPDHPDVVSLVLELSRKRNLVNLVRSNGQVRASSYPAESLDFVYIDALHTYDDTSELLRAYLPKIRPGGVLGGHDYSDDYPDVRRAVHDVLGSDVKISRQSFTWIK
jgi:hypothetical protein